VIYSLFNWAHLDYIVGYASSPECNLPKQCTEAQRTEASRTDRQRQTKWPHVSHLAVPSPCRPT